MNRAPARVAALVVALLGFLPIAAWIPGGYANSEYRLFAEEWLTGGALAVGSGVVLAILSRRARGLWWDGAGARLGAWFDRSPVAGSAAVAAAALVVYCAIAVLVFNQRPVLIDEITQVMQARIYAQGRLWLPSSAHPEFTSSLQMVDDGAKVYSQFPPGGPLMLAVGELLGASWLVGPLFGAASVVLFAAILRRAEPGAATRTGALLLFALAPFTAFMAGSHMNHVTSLAWILGAVWCLTRAVDDSGTASRRRWGWALASGFSFGIAATIRQADALAFALPAGLWYLARVRHDRRRWGDAAAAALGVAVPVFAMMWTNLQTTGAPLLSGYEVLWGPEHNLGFHRAPWGLVHTPARGIELLNLYFNELQRYLFEAPLPSLVPAIIALALARKLSGLDRYLLVSAALLCGLYFAYWHDGFFLGPRFLYALLPVMTLWTARFPGAVRDRMGDSLPYRTGVYSCVVAIAVAAAYSIPLRATQYAHVFSVERWDADRAADSAGVRHALVLVRESWESQMVVRMWALGITHSQGEVLYRAIDACRLDQAIAALERDGAVRGERAFRALTPLLADSAKLETARLAPGANVRYQPGAPYTRECIARIEETRRGVLPLSPLLLSRGTNVYARDLHERDSVLVRLHPGRELWLLAPRSPEVQAETRFFRIPLDSVPWAKDSSTGLAKPAP